MRLIKYALAVFVLIDWIGWCVLMAVVMCLIVPFPDHKIHFALGWRYLPGAVIGLIPSIYFGRLIFGNRVAYTLESVTDRRQESPDIFELPSQAEREGLQPGDLAKLIFRITHDDEVDAERLWVIVQRVRPEYYVGVLDGDSLCTDGIRSGMRVEFHADHIIQIDRVA